MGKILTHTILKTVKTHKIDAYFKKCHELKIIKVNCSLNQPTQKFKHNLSMRTDLI